MRKMHAVAFLIAAGALMASAAEWSSAKTVQSFQVIGVYDLKVTCKDDTKVYYLDQASTGLSKAAFYDLARHAMLQLAKAQNDGTPVLLSLTGNQLNGKILINAISSVQP